MKTPLVLFGLGVTVALVLGILQVNKTEPALKDPSLPSAGFGSQSPAIGPSLAELEAQLPDALFRIATNDPDLLAEGEEVYRTSCAICHGANLEGQANWQIRDEHGNLPAPPHDKSGHTWHHSDEVLFNLVKYGPGYYTPGYSGKMPAYEGVLEDREIKAVNSWIASTWPLGIQLAQRERTLASEQPR